jgi:fluoride exporter
MQFPAGACRAPGDILMQTYLAIAIGGTLGCWARYAMTNLVQGALGRDFPFATLSINVLGSFLMGFLFIATLERLTIGPHLRVGMLTGFLGGFTTFSTFAMESLLLAEQGEAAKSALYIVLSVILGVAAAFGGAFLARNL